MTRVLTMAVLMIVSSPQDEKPSEAEKILKKKTSLLRASKKDFAAFLGADASKGVVTLRLESDGKERPLNLNPDAEIRIRGSWGRLDDLSQGDRVWIWRALDREKKPAGIIFLADEISEQAVHRMPYTVKSTGAGQVVVHRVLGKKKSRKEVTRTLTPAEAVKIDEVKEGDLVYVQTAGDELRLLLDKAGIEAARQAQEKRLQARWREEGLPGTVTYVHGISGEAEVILDHETMRWARAVKAGALVHVKLDAPIRTVVQDVRPYRERTRMTLVAAGQEFSVLRPGQRVRIGVDPPADAVQASKLPPDLGRFAEREARIGWVLSSTYCGCSIGGDG